MGTHLTRMIWTRKYLLLGLGLLLLVALGLLPAAARPAEQVATAPPAQEQDGPFDCSVLDNPEVLARHSFIGLPALLAQCGRGGLSIATAAGVQAGKAARSPLAPFAPLGVDVEENNHLLDPNPHYHQDESDLAINGNTICAVYNDSASSPSTYMGFSVSTDGGATFTDRGSFSSSYGDPAVIYRQSDGYFYASSLGASGLRLYRSTDNCQTFSFQRNITSGGFNDDKELLRVDNNSSSPFYGRMYVCWTDFNVGGVIRATWSSDGGTTWSSPLTIGSGSSQQGCWPGVATNGDVYVVYITGYVTGVNNIQMTRSTNGGVSWSPTTNVATGISEPPIGSCGRPQMNGNIRTWAMPQVAIAPDGRVHVAYTRRDGSDRGNIYYQYSTDNGTSWSSPLRINDDSTTNDDWHSTIAVNANGVVVISWYDRREDSGNMLFKRYAAFSYDNGNTWQPNVAVGDVNTVVPPLLPNFDPNIADCYMGDYDSVVIDSTTTYIQWSDNRNPQGSLAGQPDMFLDRITVGTPVPTDTPTPGPSPTPSNTPLPSDTPTSTPTPPSGAWQLGPTTGFQFWRFDGEFDPDTNQVYFLGGRLANGNTDGSIWSFDPVAGTYANTGVALQTPISNYTIARLQDSTGWGLYVFGGRDSAGNATTAVQVYYPSTNTVATLTTDPWPGTAGGAPTIAAAVAVYNNKAYAFGGLGVSAGAITAVSAETWVFDPMAPAGSRWTAGPNLNRARGYIASALVDGLIYAIGGDDWDGSALLVLPDTERLDPTNLAGGWTNVADMPVVPSSGTPGCDETQATGFDTAGPYNLSGVIVVAGCGQWANEYADSFIYTVASDSWATFPALNAARRNHAGAFIPSLGTGSTPAIWVWGGRQGADSNILTSSEYFLLSAAPTATPTAVPPTETPTETPLPPTETPTPTGFSLYLPIILK